MATGDNNDPTNWKEQMPRIASLEEGQKVDLARLRAIQAQQDAAWGWHQLELDMAEEGIRDVTT